MKDFVAEFQDVLNIYLKMREDLKRIISIDDSKDPHVLINSILHNRDRLDQITLMNSRVMQLSGAWKEYRTRLDPTSREKAGDLAEAAKMQAVRLQELCGMQVQKLQAARDDLGKRLTEMGTGSRYLKSLKPMKNNYPKFIDTMY